ncbi:MAG TPA: hypothetical protein VIG51_12340 [Candidatus Baltobacteraceae bacterium]|jgi:hypothetical protein
MKSLFRSLVALLLVTSLTSPAIAATHVIAELGNAPLLGQLDSASSLQTNVARNQVLFATAGRKLGLSKAEYAQLRDRIDSSRLAYVTIPRHLDAMTWSNAGRVYVVRDVRIPANTRGWEVDLRENGQIVALFIPQKCGNLSLVRRPAPALARVSKPVHVAAASYHPTRHKAAAAPIRTAAAMPPPASAPAPAATPLPLATEVPAGAPEAIATAVPAFKPQIATPAAVSSPHLGFLLPLLGIIAIGFLAGGHNGSSNGGAPSAPIIPPPAGGGVPGCPTPAPAH